MQADVGKESMQRGEGKTADLSRQDREEGEQWEEDTEEEEMSEVGEQGDEAMSIGKGDLGSLWNLAPWCVTERLLPISPPKYCIHFLLMCWDVATYKVC